MLLRSCYLLPLGSKNLWAVHGVVFGHILQNDAQTCCVQVTTRPFFSQRMSYDHHIPPHHHATVQVPLFRLQHLHETLHLATSDRDMRSRIKGERKSVKAERSGMEWRNDVAPPSMLLPCPTPTQPGTTTSSTSETARTPPRLRPSPPNPRGRNVLASSWPNSLWPPCRTPPDRSNGLASARRSSENELRPGWERHQGEWRVENSTSMG